MELGKNYSLAVIIQSVSDDSLSGDFCLYGDDSKPLSLDAIYLLEAYPQVEQDRDLYPDRAVQQGLQLVCYGDDLTDVVLSVLEQKPQAAPDDFLQALLYYHQHDDFLDFK